MLFFRNEMTKTLSLTWSKKNLSGAEALHQDQDQDQDQAYAHAEPSRPDGGGGGVRGEPSSLSKLFKLS